MLAKGVGVATAALGFDGAFRVIYVAKFEDAVYVLHCFQKKTQKTEQRDLDVAKARYKAIEQEIRS